MAVNTIYLIKTFHEQTAVINVSKMHTYMCYYSFYLKLSTVKKKEDYLRGEATL